MKMEILFNFLKESLQHLLGQKEKKKDNMEQDRIRRVVKARLLNEKNMLLAREEISELELQNEYSQKRWLSFTRWEHVDALKAKIDDYNFRIAKLTTEEDYQDSMNILSGFAPKRTSFARRFWRKLNEDI